MSNFILPDCSELLVPKTRGVRVGRRGERVLLWLGNAGPYFFTWEEAMRTGQRWLREGLRAARERRTAELRLHHHKLFIDPGDMQRLAHWLTQKGAEAKVVAGRVKELLDIQVERAYSKPSGPAPVPHAWTPKLQRAREEGL